MDDFGGRLRQARERRGISLRQISASTKISVGALEALERNDISKLPGGIFSRAFVRSYALEVGLDPEQTVHDFVARFDEAPPAEGETPAATSMAEEDTAFEKRRLAALRVARLVGIVAPVVFFASLFVVLRHRSQARAAKTPIAASAPAITAAPAIETPAPADVPPSEVPTASKSSGAAGSAPAVQVSLDLHPTADCWVSATADGKKLFARVMNAGEHETVTFHRDATIDVGDAGSFAYSINGLEGKPLGDKGQVKTLKLTPTTIADHVR